jgi:hypothetical protein
MTAWSARMFEPDGRAALTEQLRPPSGFQLSYAVATTFTLDLTTALSVPLAFAAHRVRESRDPIAILDAVRRAADRIDMFAQAGQVFEPSVNSALFALLEPMIHPVQAPNEAMLFHPKVWVLEYSNGETRNFRMLCASRNLTNDRSWDLIVRLDGISGDNPSEQSEPLAAFVRALPEMSVQPLSGERVARIRALAQAVTTVEWELPNDVRSLRFHPFGIPETPQPPLHDLFDGIRHGIVSPFLSDDGISRIVPPHSASITVLSRREQLDRLKQSTLERISEALVLDDAANDDDDAPPDAAQPGHRLEPFVGLHAKAFVLDRRSGSHLFVGSANATEAALGGNVEMLVEFEGPQPRLGVSALLGEDSPLRPLTISFQPIGNVETPADELADYALEQSLRVLAGRRYLADVVLIEGECPDASQQQYGIRLSVEEPANAPAGVKAMVTLLTRPANTAPVPGEHVLFDRLTLTDITPFIVIRITDDRGVTASTVVTAELRGDVAGRHDAVIAGQLADRAAFMRLLALLLAIEGGDGLFSFESLSSGAGGWAEDGSGLFETLVKAVGVEHDGLADVRRIVEHLREGESSRADGAPSLLPDGFDALWESVWAAYSASRQDFAK